MIDFFSRLDSYMNFKGLNDNKLTVEAGISNGLIGKARKRGSLSQDNISKILYKCSDLDANWLFTGDGSMLKIEQKGDPPDGSIYKELSEARKEIIELLKKITFLEKEVGSLREKINIDSSVSRGAMEFLNEPKLGEKIGK
jgi:hypothetical protein